MVRGSAKRETADLHRDALDGRSVRRFQLLAVEGPDKGIRYQSSADRCSIGSHESNDLVLGDAAVSRFHCDVRVEARGFRVRDLESKNGTTLDGTAIVEAYLRTGSLLKVGCTVLQFQLGAERIELPLSARTRFGSLVGSSAAMRGAFAVMERAAASDATVLLEGETGTGKEGAAEAIHLGGARRDGPLVVVDCGGIPRDLLESELFGHEKGAFTGALVRRAGAFQSASGGTILLDEIGELSPDLQPKLLRVLERREVRPVGSDVVHRVDVRVIAATNRDLRTEVNAGRFRADLYFRLAVVRVPLPPLRARPGDLPELVEELLAELGGGREAAEALRSAEFLEQLAHAAWPGNVRELRNHLERCLVLRQPLPIAGAPDREPEPSGSERYPDARRRALAQFERRFLQGALARHGGKVAAAAVDAGIDRVYFYKLLRRHGLLPST
jgi:transcriptional regulator with GAF, ATPase, and Fis domain